MGDLGVIRVRATRILRGVEPSADRDDPGWLVTPGTEGSVGSLDPAVLVVRWDHAYQEDEDGGPLERELDVLLDHPGQPAGVLAFVDEIDIELDDDLDDDRDRDLDDPSIDGGPSGLRVHRPSANGRAHHGPAPATVQRCREIAEDLRDIGASVARTVEQAVRALDRETGG